MQALLSPTELATAFEAQMQRDWKGDVKQHWTPNLPSDHLPRVYQGQSGLKLVTWNILNFHWMNYLVEDEGRMESRFFSMDPKVNAERCAWIVEVIAQYVGWQFIVCLQEVSKDMLAMIRERLRAGAPVQPGFQEIFVSLEDERNCNITIFDTTMYKMTADHMLLCANPAIRRAQTNYMVMAERTRPGVEVKFNLANVHVNWRDNADLIDACKRELVDGSSIASIVCGDFNMSCRMPPEGPADHITMYEKLPTALFAMPDAPSFSHVNLRKNVTSEDRRLDLLDNILFLASGTPSERYP